MKLGGAPGTLLTCGIALGGVRCATDLTQYKPHPYGTFRNDASSQEVLLTSNYAMITLYAVVAGTIRHSPQIRLNPLIRTIVGSRELANVRMIAIQSKHSLSRCSELGGCRVNDVLVIFESAKPPRPDNRGTRHAGNLRHESPSSKFDIHHARFQESENLIVSNLRPELIFRNLIQQRRLLQRFEQRVFGLTGQCATQLRGGIRNTGSIPAAMRRCEEHQPIR